MQNTRAAPAVRVPPPVRPLVERARDASIATGGSGAFAGACIWAYKGRSALLGAAVWGSSLAALGGAFVGLRYAIIGGDFRQDKEVVTGLAMGMLASGTIAPTVSPRAGAFAGGAGFVGGCLMHYAHRYWLHFRWSRGI